MITDVFANRHMRGISDTLTNGPWRTTDRDLASRIAVVSREPEIGTGSDLTLTRRLDPAEHRDRYGRPVRQRIFTKHEYVDMWESRIGRRMTADELHTLDRGCVGLTLLRLGRNSEKLPPSNLMFGHPRTPQSATVLALGEAANAEIRRCRALRVAAYDELAAARRGPGATDGSPDVLRRLDEVMATEYDLRQARAAARQVWSDIPAEQIKQARTARTEARIHDGEQALAVARGYAAKFDEILSGEPANVAEFQRRVHNDPALSQLSDVTANLPTTGSPADWEPVIFAKHLWSGQDYVRDPAGREVISDGRRQYEATDSPKYGRFLPGPATGQVNMWGDFHRNRLGFLNYDYAWYDAPTDTWWRANHSETGDPHRPMLVYQSTSEAFFTGSADFDTTVVGIGFADRSG
ncbi:hypothetical protein [Nocardia jinanensis]|nr:hypothetical protein [Nocardia jinanensis]